ncbi:MAG: hypothetical protein LUE29_01910, partial [Lachnospiraceae bacterium]|nr:hypothetical protein [Lachnospiraceae bacterium]
KKSELQENLTPETKKANGAGIGSRMRFKKKEGKGRRSLLSLLRFYRHGSSERKSSGRMPVRTLRVSGGI